MVCRRTRPSVFVALTKVFRLTNFSSFLAVLFLFRKNKLLASRRYPIQIAGIAHNLVTMILTLVMW
jgi:hypothetical protein